MTALDGTCAQRGDPDHTMGFTTATPRDRTSNRSCGVNAALAARTIRNGNPDTLRTRTGILFSKRRTIPMRFFDFCRWNSGQSRGKEVIGLTKLFALWAESDIQVCDGCQTRMVYRRRTDLYHCPRCKNARMGNLVRWLKTEYPKRA